MASKFYSKNIPGVNPFPDYPVIVASYSNNTIVGYQTIQAAINNCSIMDDVYIVNGSYAENVVVSWDKRINIHFIAISYDPLHIDSLTIEGRATMTAYGDSLEIDTILNVAGGNARLSFSFLTFRGMSAQINVSDDGILLCSFSNIYNLNGNYCITMSSGAICAYQLGLNSSGTTTNITGGTYYNH